MWPLGAPTPADRAGAGRTEGRAHSFRFYNRVYDHVYVASNGYLTFNGTDTDYSESVFDHFRYILVNVLPCAGPPSKCFPTPAGECRLRLGGVRM